MLNEPYAAIRKNLVAQHFREEQKTSPWTLRALFRRRCFAWTDGELLIWISDNRGYDRWLNSVRNSNKRWAFRLKSKRRKKSPTNFRRQLTSGKGPDIFFWANDRIGEWADAGLLKPLKIKEDFKAAFLPMAWEAVTHRKRSGDILSPWSVSH